MYSIAHRLSLPLILLLITYAFGFAPVTAKSSSDKAQKTIEERYAQTTEKIISRATSSHHAFERLTWFTDYFPHRHSGSQMLEDAIDWTMEALRADGIPEVRSQLVEVPHWVRGNEHARMLTPYEKDLPMLGFGMSVATPPEGITAPTLVVESFEELEERQDEIKGKIVVYNQAYVDYGQSVQYRVWGADRASAHGALAVLVRAVSPNSMGHPHAGTMRYSDNVPKIPAASISAEDAMLLHRFDQRSDPATVTLYMEAETMEQPALSRNVIAELPGSEFPDEVVVIGGHIDSWDIGHGAMDDGGGVIVTWEALRLIHEMGLKPRRTIRLVLWTNEEIGVAGGRAYRDKVLQKDEVERHQLAFEVDLGVFEPRGFGFVGSDEAFTMLEPVAALMQPMGEMYLRKGAWGTVDINALSREGIPIMGLDVDIEKYFWYHHSAKDTIDKLDPDEVAKCVAAVAVMTYVVADMAERLPR